MIIAVHLPTLAVGKKKPEKTKLFHIFHTISLPKCGFKAQLWTVEHRTSIAKVRGSNPVEALIFCQVSSFQLLKLEKSYFDDHSSLSYLEITI